MKAIRSEPRLASVVVPRSVLAWLRNCEEYEGAIPGVSNTYLRLSKSQETYSGAIALQDSNYEFEKATPGHVAAAVAVALGCSPGALPRSVVLVRFGAAIDTLVKAQSEIKGLRSFMKAEAPGGPSLPHPPIAPAGAIAPTAPAAQAKPRQGKGQQKPKLPKQPKGAKLNSVSVSKSEAAMECAACGGSQLNNNRLVGCLCIRDVIASLPVTAYSDGWVLDTTEDTTEESHTALQAILRGGK